MNRKTIFLDRDGVINEKSAEHDYTKTWEEFRFLPRVPDAIAMFNEAGFRVVIITNQRGVARGILTIDQVEAIHGNMRAALARSGASVDGIYVCPHEVGTCTCRKPEIGLFRRAEADEPVDKARSYMIGDSESDIAAGKRYGIRTILIVEDDRIAEDDRSGFDQDFRSPTLYDAAQAITEGKI
jgi:histidinol-phosphate phosphatase family protein